MSNVLDVLLPPAVLADCRRAAEELPRAVLMRINFIPGVRQRLGWRGVRECTAGRGGLTVRIAGHEGVYGIAVAGSNSMQGQGTADFDLFYFPDPDEDLLEGFSVAACLEAFQEDYWERVREFVAHPRMQLFRIARVAVDFSPEGRGVQLGLQGSERQLVISSDGVRVINQGVEQQVVPAGGADQDLAAWELALAFFRILAASFSFCLDAPPDRLRRWRRAGEQIIYTQSGLRETAAFPGSSDLLLALDWGDPAAGEYRLAAEYPRVDLDWRTGSVEKPWDYRDEPWWTAQVPGAGFSVDKNSMGINERPRLIVLSGFLGAGKTSFLNHFIEYQAGRNAFVAIIQNEIGARGLDSRLLGQHYAVRDMDEGCVCCTLAGNLKLALADILSGYQPDFVVLETTGLANPANLLAEVAELADQLEFCSVTTVVDATQGLRPLERYGVAREQLALADVVLLNKADLVAAEQLDELECRVRQLNPLAELQRTSHGDISPALLYGVNLTGPARLPASLQETDLQGHTHQQAGIRSELVRFSRPLAREDFLSATASFPEQLLRAKGIVQFYDDDVPQVYQYVPGMQSLKPLDSDDDAGERFLVLIGEEIENVVAPFQQALQLDGFTV